MGTSSNMQLLVIFGLVAAAAALPSPYVHTEIPAEPYIHQEVAAEPYIHIEPYQDIPAEPCVHVDIPAEPYVHIEPAASHSGPAWSGLCLNNHGQSVECRQSFRKTKRKSLDCLFLRGMI